MWIHIVIFAAVIVLLAAWKAGWIKIEGMEEPSGRRLFAAAALGGNLLGLLLTLGSGSPVIYSDGHRLAREETGSYEQEFLVSVDGEEAGSMYVQVPEKVTGEEDSAPEEEKLSEEEIRIRALKEAVAHYNEEKDDPDYYYLPSQWEGRHLDWELPGDHSGNILAALSLFAAVVLLLKKAREKQEEKMRRAEQLMMDYPSLVMKFTLLVQAGMTVRKAFQKIASDYLRKSGKKERYAYEEIAVTCFEMESGVSEAEAYRRFGERCGQLPYKTFATLLIQNLQKGSRRMSDMLEKESLEAWEERKRKARVLGEAAATKLLLPMVLMLVVVMAVIMIPAFLSFYG